MQLSVWRRRGVDTPEELYKLLAAVTSPALARAIERLLMDRGLRVRLANRARRLIDAEFDIHRNTARLRAIFQQALQPSTVALSKTG